MIKTNEGGTTAFPSFCDGKAFLYVLVKLNSVIQFKFLTQYLVRRKRNANETTVSKSQCIIDRFWCRRAEHREGEKEYDS
ncbi:hypothetical protein ABE61_08310 [Lysinibacillus sphaericus]|nr:hypothetical protein [Lysinibacillus sphaericus]MBG9477385.1 hypothetical protein [Lysinibacillus sphaericus]MBG9593567.1 hypothetical protein [Lysinibacillus sphaericus]